MRKIVAIAALMLYPFPVGAREPNPELDSLIRRYDDCFAASAGSQFAAKISAEANGVAERAFQACNTEEQTLFAYLTLRGMSPITAQAAILKRRNLLKRGITG